MSLHYFQQNNTTMRVLLILLLNIKLPSIQTLQSFEENSHKNSWRDYFSQFREPNEQEEDIQTIIKTEIEKIDVEMNQVQKEKNQLAYNSTADNLTRRNIRALCKEELKPANRILLQIRNYLYYAENVCLKSINKMSSRSESTIMQVDHGKHYNRWMLFFDECIHEDFLTISTKFDKSLGRSICCEQIGVLFSLTNNFKNFGVRDKWYKKAIYSKQSILESLKKYATLDDNFLTFFDIMYDVVVAFHERWKIND